MASADTLRSFGEQLRSERQKQRRSLDDIASSIKIHRRHLEAIEAGDLTSLPQGPYVMAFVREYARSLNVPLPAEYAPPPMAAGRSSRDPNVVSHPAGKGPDIPPLSQVAKETARIANTAVKSAVKTVTKTTESVVNLVETGGKEALEVLTSKSLWEEAEDIRRERHGLPPLERKPEAPKVEPPRKEETPEKEESPIFAEVTQRVSKARTSKRATNVVITLLAMVFAVAAYFAIRMSHTGSEQSAASKEYVPAPLEKPQIPVERKVEKAATPPVAAAPAIKDSLQFMIRATQPVWVSIAPDGIPAYKGEMKPGEVKTFHAGTKFVVNIGNQKSVSMAFNGTPLSGLPTIQNSSVVVRDLVLMRDRVLLGGNAVDYQKLTSTPPPPAPKVALPTAVPSPQTNAKVNAKSVNANAKSANNRPATTLKGNTKTSVKSMAKKTQSNSAVKTPTSKPASKQTQSSASKQTTNSKTSKKSSAPQIHPVEPIPPSP